MRIAVRPSGAEAEPNGAQRRGGGKVRQLSSAPEKLARKAIRRAGKMSTCGMSTCRMKQRQLACTILVASCGSATGRFRSFASGARLGKVSAHDASSRIQATTEGSITFAAASVRKFECDERQKDRLCCDRLPRWGGAHVATICTREKKLARTSPFRRFPSLCLRFSRGSGPQAPVNTGQLPVRPQRLSYC